MFKRIGFWLLALWFTAPVMAAEIPAPKITKINDRVYALLGPMELPNKHNQGYMVNSTLIIGDKAAILVDTGFSDEIGAHLAKAVAGITPKPVKHVFNTHHHGDHVFGNSAFASAQVISSEMCRKLFIQTEADWRATAEALVGRKFPNARAVPATRVYPAKSRTPLVLEGVKLELWVPEAAHTLGDMMIWLPDDQVLIGGDILVHQVTPNFRDANVKLWVQTLAEVQKLPLKTVVPGHGLLMGKADVAALHQRMDKLYAGIEAGYKAGLTDAEIRKKLDLSEWKKLRHFEEQMGGNINKAYLEIEAASF
jgi:glyoxylase-like metal-dependent hydrolase (beta-lactamase superfamily II)